MHYLLGLAGSNKVDGYSKICGNFSKRITFFFKKKLHKSSQEKSSGSYYTNMRI